MNWSVPSSPPLMTAAAMRMPTTSTIIAQNSVVLNEAFVSWFRSLIAARKPVARGASARVLPVAPVVAMDSPYGDGVCAELRRVARCRTAALLSSPRRVRRYRSDSGPDGPSARRPPGQTHPADTLDPRMSVSPPTRAIPENLADLVGNTPMVRLGRVAPDCGAEVIGKLESHNPGGSVKDRIGVAMIEAAEAGGLIEPGKSTIVE